MLPSNGGTPNFCPKRHQISVSNRVKKIIDPGALAKWPMKYLMRFNGI